MRMAQPVCFPLWVGFSGNFRHDPQDGIFCGFVFSSTTYGYAMIRELCDNIFSSPAYRTKILKKQTNNPYVQKNYLFTFELNPRIVSKIGNSGPAATQIKKLIFENYDWVKDSNQTFVRSLGEGRLNYIFEYIRPAHTLPAPTPFSYCRCVFLGVISVWYSLVVHLSIMAFFTYFWNLCIRLAVVLSRLVNT